MKGFAFASILLLSVALTGCSNDDKNQSVSSSSLPTNVDEKKIEKDNDSAIEKSITTGLSVDNKTIHNPFGIMIENTELARPQSGLINADIVYEIETEAMITRFFAIFNDENTSLVGPSRSSRHYFIPIAAEWNLPYIHFGGSPQAYEMLKEYPYTHIDGITNGQYFMRDSTRKAPHNAYLLPEKLPKFTEKSINQHFSFGAQSYKNYPDANTVTLTYNPFTHIQYEFDKKDNLYKRFLESKPHLDRETDKQISVNNVIVQYAKHESIQGDSSGRIHVDLFSSGKSTYFISGKVIEGTWENNGSTTKYYDENGDLIRLTPGKTWIQVVRDNKSVTFNK
jgi:hypothetical protein